MRGIVITLFGAFLVFASCAEKKSVESADENTTTAVAEKTVTKDIEPEEFKELMANENVIVLDVRSAEEVAVGKIEGSVNVDFYSETFKEEVAKLDQSKEVLIYCAGGVRSKKAMNIMTTLNFPKLYNLLGGYGKWSSLGYPTVK